MLDNLPHELILCTLHYLDIPSLRSLRMTSGAWNALFIQYRETIYKGAATLHGFSSPGASIEDTCASYATSWLEYAGSWEEICKRFRRLDRAWKGDGPPPSQHVLTSTGPRAHRFKVVPEDRVLIMTVGRAEGQPLHGDIKDVHGHLVTIDIETDTVLWVLPQRRVRAYAHCEYDAGYLVFDRQGNSLEVWRRASGMSDLATVPAESRPDERMTLAAAEAYRADPSSLRGIFEPHALLTVPALGWAYHTVGTNLVVASQLARRAFVFDIARGILLETLDLDSGADTGERWEHINYVDIDPPRRRVLVATDVGVYVYENRTTNEGESSRTVTVLVARVPVLEDANSWTMYHIGIEENAFILDAEGEEEFWLTTLNAIVDPHTPLNFAVPDSMIFAVHVSPCGEHLAMLSRTSLIVIRDYLSSPNDTYILQLPNYADATYLAFDGMHIAVGMSEGVLVTDVDLSKVVWLRPKMEQTHMYSCVQLTREALWTTWGHANFGGNFPASVLCFGFGDAAAQPVTSG
ncbi:hypothetical protein EXIGLDRAFT_838951 [Exidia glandulosa HHB12029]|uniref:F-box domain-containing protein n=1 Tax=Exidia glandulosa HHB12029 TaxID=1314781 RepID=A0A165FE09_EXIGL|nr:hypothetical protein EXIGLDRAFT_846972 [Exidia glandulosa HHB12029]KZV88838.1 hypothetical protein EXIGLDRAFT_838951 [Exidia glandulosa HHB12029]